MGQKIILFILALSLAYLAGSIPFRMFFEKYLSRRTFFSNRPYLGTFGLSSLEIGKGVIAVWIGGQAGAVMLSDLLGFEMMSFPVDLSWWAGVFGVYGHSHNPWGNKKSSLLLPALGTMFMLSPIAALGGVLGFWVSQISAQSYLLAYVSAVICAGMFHLVFSAIASYLWAGAALMVLVISQNEAEIDAFLENSNSAP